MEDTSHSHQGELSLMEFMQNLQQQSPTRDMDHSTAKLAIELNEERQRRQECEKLNKQLQSQISAIQQEQAVAVASIQRKDSLLHQAQQQWTRFEKDLQQKLTSVLHEKDALSSRVSRLEDQLKTVQQEAQRARQEAADAMSRYDQRAETLDAALSENRSLKEANAKYQSQVNQVSSQWSDANREKDALAKKSDELQRECHQLKGQIEDFKREKECLQVELDLFQERYESNRHQWEMHCQARVEGTMHLAQEEADRRMKLWQSEVETKLRHLVSTLQQQLGRLKEKNVEESKQMIQRHEEEMNLMRSRCAGLQKQVEQHQKEQNELTQQMRQLVEAQWNTVNRLGNPSPVLVAPRYVPATPVANVYVNDTVSEVSSKSSSTKVPSSTYAKRSDIQKYVSEVIERQNLSREGSNVHRRKP